MTSTEKQKEVSNMSPKLDISKADALNWLAVERLRAWLTLSCEAGALNDSEWASDSPD